MYLPPSGSGQPPAPLIMEVATLIHQMTPAGHITITRAFPPIKIYKYINISHFHYLPNNDMSTPAEHITRAFFLIKMCHSFDINMSNFHYLPNNVFMHCVLPRFQELFWI